MADKKLSSVSAVSDMNYVYAETSTGETVKISKSDLASVVAGLMPSASLTKDGKMTSSMYANASFFGLSTGSSGANTLYRICSIETGYITKASIMIAGQYTSPFTLDVICGDGKVTKIGSGNSSYLKIYKDSSYMYVWLSSSLGSYSRGGVSFFTVYASLVKVEDVTSTVNLSTLTEV